MPLASQVRPHCFKGIGFRDPLIYAIGAIATTIQSCSHFRLPDVIGSFITSPPERFLACQGDPGGIELAVFCGVELFHQVFSKSEVVSRGDQDPPAERAALAIYSTELRLPDMIGGLFAAPPVLAMPEELFWIDPFIQLAIELLVGVGIVSEVCVLADIAPEAASLANCAIAYYRFI